MNQNPQRREATSPAPSASTPGDARKLAENMMDVMSALLGVIERETELVRAGMLREAMALEPQKTDLSRRYVNGQHRDAAAQYSQHLYGRRTACDSRPAPHDADRGQPLDVTRAALAFFTSREPAFPAPEKRLPPEIPTIFINFARPR